MNKEEAIKILSQMRKDGEGFLSDDTIEAYDMAIEALQKEPCGDFISRESVNDLVRELGNILNGTENKRDVSTVLTDILYLPTVTPQPCEDCISRQAVLEKAINVPIAKIVTDDKVICRKVIFVDDVEKLPPVTPQQKMGRWLVLKDEYDDVVEAVCSCCDKNGNHKWKFCPWCGQPKMQEVEENGIN